MRAGVLSSLGLLTTIAGGLIHYISHKSMNRYSKLLKDFHDPEQLKSIMDHHEKIFGIKPKLVAKESSQ